MHSYISKLQLFWSQPSILLPTRLKGASSWASKSTLRSSYNDSSLKSVSQWSFIFFNQANGEPVECSYVWYFCAKCYVTSKVQFHNSASSCIVLEGIIGKQPSRFSIIKALKTLSSCKSILTLTALTDRDFKLAATSLGISHSGYCFMICDSCVSWLNKKQPIEAT